ncbi:MAG: single-stranded DNA-binding protein [Phycisphaerales bacterium]|nr:single-stranded DNA-binding protein [Phycisphaerales bacterium]
MASYNKVLLMGNLTRDIELRYLPNSNTAVANIGLAVNRRFRAGDGEMREETAFIDCEAFGRTAETMGQYLKKGRPVFVEGRLKLDQWQDRDSGQNRSKLKVVIESFQFIDAREGAGGGGGGGGGGGSYGGGSRASAPAGGPHEAINEDDIPF